MLLESPLLRLPVTRLPMERWRARHLAIDCCNVLTIGRSDRVVNSFPIEDAQYDVVVLDRSLNVGNLDNRKNMLGEALRVVKKNGKVIANAEACNSQQELLDIIYPTGLSVEPFVKSLLNNKDIIALKPHEAVFISNWTSFRNHDLLLAHASTIFPGVTLTHLNDAPARMAINTLEVGMVWEKDKL